MKKTLLLSLLFGIYLAPQAQIPDYLPSNGLVGWWPFNGNANDESGNGDHGLTNNCAMVADQFGNPNSAYFFDKNNNYIELNLTSINPFKRQ
jgi:hypothetical protein